MVDKVVSMNITDVWDVTPCSSVNNYKIFRFVSRLMWRNDIKIYIKRNRARGRGLD